VRGLGVQAVPALPFAEIGLVVRPGEPERMPEPKDAERLGLRLPQITLAYQEASAPAKLGRALGALYLGRERRM
jgi:hypothetical protein